MVYKKTVFIGAIILFGVAFIFSEPVYFHICKNTYTTSNYVGCLDRFPGETIIQLVGFLSLSLLVLSLVTYWMKEQVSRAWWNFARWWVVAIIVVTLYIEGVGSGSSGMGVGGAISGWFNNFIESILYAIMIIGSLIRIVKMYLKTRRNK